MSYQRLLMHVTFATSILGCINLEASAQTPTEVENVVRESKGVDKSRPIRAAVNASATTISTYSHPQASDQDCKINALFIMKDLLKQFKTINCIRVSFFDPKNPKCYRTVQVLENDVARVNGGKPVAEVLKELKLTIGRMPDEKSQAASALEANIGGIAAKLGAKTVVSTDGDVSLNAPEGVVLDNPEPGVIIRCVTLNVLVNIYREDLAGRTFSQVVRKMEADSPSKYKGWKKITEQGQTLRGLRAHYEECTYLPSSRIRALAVCGRKHVYVVAVEATKANDAQAIEVYRQIVPSISIKD